MSMNKSTEELFENQTADHEDHNGESENPLVANTSEDDANQGAERITFKEFLKKRRYPFIFITIVLITIVIVVTIVMLFQNNAVTPQASKCTFIERNGLSAMTCYYNDKKVLNPMSLSSFDDGTKCSISCCSDFIIDGPNNITCDGTSWKPKQSHCTNKQCPPLPLPPNLQSVCSKERNIGSLCSFSCPNGFHLEGPTSITCQPSMKWSANIPTCSKICPPCFTGRYCSESISWQSVKNDISDEPFAFFSVRYASFKINCENRIHSAIPLTWTCECTDVKTSSMMKCSDYQSPSGSCEHSLATLMRSMIQQNKYPEPCDASTMPYGCKN